MPTAARNREVAKKRAKKTAAKKTAAKKRAKPAAKKKAVKKKAAQKAPAKKKAAKKTAAQKTTTNNKASKERTAQSGTKNATKKKRSRRNLRSTPSAPGDFAGFGPGLFEFLAELSVNNDREWFAANKARYEEQVRGPALAFIRAMAPEIRAISPHMTAIDKKVGGSLMRIHRDVRFSGDKSPYKTNLGIQFRHAAGKDVHAPGFYFHVDTEGVFLGAGAWHPDREALAAIRAKISDRAKAWVAARDASAFRAHWSLAGESLSRAPRGYDPAHPMIEDLKRKDHLAKCDLSLADLMSPRAVERVAERYAASKRYMAFLCAAMDVPF
ncbi:DUF2461 domain-containing protein [Pseudenhygromyxa sp. WMMC2535]|uniref:DUF2461 domain-containing protein n=1 Tax=Pseudenhygromyxa sp. WMMC2535 TaxID=2712867 RepID=UPI001C3C4FBC|nr:DUF2461 domain-containing protein [Pseudenhygromyxa sp. WMMC2535]